LSQADNTIEIQNDFVGGRIKFVSFQPTATKYLSFISVITFHTILSEKRQAPQSLYSDQIYEKDAEKT